MLASPIIRPVSLPLTLAALSSVPALRRIGILSVELVTGFAVCLPRVDSRRTCASRVVLAAGNRFQVQRIDASRCPAKMVYFCPFWNRADKKLVGEAMG